MILKSKGLIHKNCPVCDQTLKSETWSTLSKSSYNKSNTEEEQTSFKAPFSESKGIPPQFLSTCSIGLHLYSTQYEPELFYRLITNKGQRTLRLCFNQNARPLWDQSDDELFIDFPMDDLDLKASSNSLHKQLQLHKSEERTKLEMKPIDEWTTLSV